MGLFFLPRWNQMDSYQLYTKIITYLDGKTDIFIPRQLDTKIVRQIGIYQEIQIDIHLPRQLDGQLYTKIVRWIFRYQNRQMLDGIVRYRDTQMLDGQLSTKIVRWIVIELYRRVLEWYGIYRDCLIQLYIEG